MLDAPSKIRHEYEIVDAVIKEKSNSICLFLKQFGCETEKMRHSQFLVICSLFHHSLHL